MTSNLKSFLIQLSKNAVNGALTAGGMSLTFPTQFHFHDWNGVWHVIATMGSAAISRELVVYIPKLYAWSQSTNGTPKT